MFKTKNCSTVLCFSAFVAVIAIATLSNTVHSLAVHPAVLKNFVGPYRVRQGEPILRATIPFARSEVTPVLNFAGESLIDEDNFPANVQEYLEPHQASYHSKHTAPFDAEKALRSCEGRASCRRNLDSTLNLLMKMMETGR